MKWWMKFEATPQVTPKKAVHFDSTHNDWCTVPNFMTMYEEMYEAMVQSGVAIKQNKEVVVDRDGKVVQRSEDLAFEKKNKYLLLHPDLVLFIDEVGDNMSHKNDGNVGSQKFLVQILIHQ